MKGPPSDDEIDGGDGMGDPREKTGVSGQWTEGTLMLKTQLND